MPISKIKTSGIEDSAITSAKIGVDVIVAEDIANNAITVAELSDGAVTSAKLADDAVTSAKLDTNIDIAGTLDVTGDLTADSGVKLPTASGGVYTITGTDTATNRSLTLPDEAGTVLTSASSIPTSQITGSLGALVLVTSGTVDSVANLNVDGCFTSDYLNYKMHFNFYLADNALGDLDFGLYFRAGGSSKTDSNYQYSMGYKNFGLNAEFNFQSTTGAGFIKLIDNVDGGDTHAVGWIDVYSPASTDGSGKSYILSELFSNDNGYNKIMWSQGVYTPDVAVDGFQLSTFNGGGTFDGSYQIYGYALS